MRASIFMMIGALMLAVMVAGCEEEKQTGDLGGLTIPTLGIEQKNCPVMGGPIDKNYSVDYKGQKVYFCCEACIGKFNAEPEKHLPKLDVWCAKCNMFKAVCACPKK